MSKFTEEDMDGIIESKDLESCMMCGKQTPYIEICCEGRLCSPECVDSFYEMYTEILNNCDEYEEYEE